MVTARQIRRATRPSLLGTAARTAVITKTATSVAGASAARQRAAMAQEAQSQVPAAAPAPEPAADRFAQLRELGELHNAGILNDEEFQAEKARILGT